MKPRFILLTTLALFSAAAPAFAETTAPPAPNEAAAAPVKEADFAKTLLGSWRHDLSEGEAKGYSITTYLEGGKATSVAHFMALATRDSP